MLDWSYWLSRHLPCRSVSQPIVVDSDDEEADEKLENCKKQAGSSSGAR